MGNKNGTRGQPATSFGQMPSWIGAGNPFMPQQPQYMAPGVTPGPTITSPGTPIAGPMAPVSNPPGWGSGTTSGTLLPYPGVTPGPTITSPGTPIAGPMAPSAQPMDTRDPRTFSPPPQMTQQPSYQQPSDSAAPTPYADWQQRYTQPAGDPLQQQTSAPTDTDWQRRQRLMRGTETQSGGLLGTED